jgi:hypothetical protein
MTTFTEKSKGLSLISFIEQFLDETVGYLKMKVIEDLKSQTMDDLVKDLASNGTEMDTDDSTSYVKLKKNIPRHNAQVIPKEKVGEVLPWVHIAQ